MSLVPLGIFRCANCHGKLTSTLGPLPREVRQGDTIVCSHCLRFSRFNAQLQLEPLEPEIEEAMMRDPVIRDIQWNVFATSMSLKADLN